MDSAHLSIRRRDISQADVIRYIDATRGSAPVTLPRMDLFVAAVVLARPDGVFVMRVEIQRGFPAEDIDEVGWVVSSIAKIKLGHVHDVHRASRKPSTSLLTPSKTLVIYPIRLHRRGWPTHFRTETFNDANLRATRCELPLKAPPGATGRPALVQLRRAYLKVFEDLLGRLAIDRGLQSAWRAGPQRFLLLVLGLIVVLALNVVLMGWPNDLGGFAKSWLSTKLIVALVTIMPTFAIAVGFLAQVLRWDTPRIQLLRSAVLFYQYANPLNRAFGRIAGLETDGFGDIIDILKTKTEGEVHRSAVHQTWLTLALAFATLMFAALAIHGDGPMPEKGAFVGKASPSPAPNV